MWENEFMTTAYQVCTGSSPLVIFKSGDIITLEYPTATNQNFQWGNWSCVSTSTSDVFTTSTMPEIIRNNETGAEFYLDKTLNYGDVIMFWFLSIFLVYQIFKVTYSYFWKK
jgi:hypothetical protein